MLRCTIVLLAALTIASCRAGFPSLSGGPENPPTMLTEAQTAAPEQSLQLQHEGAEIAAARADAVAPSPDAEILPPRKLLAVLPLTYAETAPAGIVERAAEASLASGRPVIIVGLGDGAEAAVSAMARALASRGVTVREERMEVDAGAPSRIDLYLGA